MDVVTHKLLGKEVEPPIDSGGLEIEIQFDTEDPHASPRVKLSSTNWSVKEAKIINDHVAEFGIHAGIPYEQIVTDGNNTLKTLDAYLKPSGKQTVFECNKVSNIPVVLRNKNESITAQAKLVYFNVLLANGGITKDQYIQVPYVRSTIPDYYEAAFAAGVAFAAAQKLVDIGKEIAKVIGELLSVIGAISGVIKALIVVLWIIISLIAIILFVLQIAQHLIQPVKYHAGMLLLDQLKAGCKAMGLDFVSSIFDDERYAHAVLWPAKPATFKDKTKRFALGFTTPSDDSRGYYKKSFYELLVLVKSIFNAKISINSQNELILERADKNDSTANLVLPDLPLDSPKTNASELISNYELAFRVDESDDNTTDNYEGTTTNALTTSNSGADIIDLSSEGEGYKLVQIEAARATRKEGFTDIEAELDEQIKNNARQISAIIDLVNAMSKVTDSIIKQVNKTINRLKLIGIKVPFDPQPIPTTFVFDENIIERRIGMPVLSNPYFTVDKLMSLDIASSPFNTKLKEDNSEIWHSGNLYDEHHFIQSHAATIDGVPFGNQYGRHELGNFILCLADVIKIIDNNRTFTHDGRKAKIESMLWQEFTGEVKKGRIRIRKVHDDNLETNVITESGE